MRRAGRVHDAVGFGPTDHVCWPHEGGGSWRDAAVAFLEEGARAGDRLVYVGAGHTDELLDALVGLPGRDGLLESGRLSVVPIGDMFAGGSRTTIARLRTTVQTAVASGSRALRVAGDVTSRVAEAAAGRRHAAHDVLVDAVAAVSPLILMCGYDARRTSLPSQRALQLVHPLQREIRVPAPAGLFADEGRWRLSGEVDREVVDLIELGFAALPTDRDLVLDVRDLAFLDVAGLRAITVLAERMAPARRVVLDGAGGLLVHVLGLWGPVPGLEVRPS